MSVAQINDTGQYLAFKLDNELFGVGVDKIREILDYTVVTKVPQMPPFMRGVINLRGTVVPVIDMRRKFQIVEGEDTVDTCIVVLEVCVNEETTVIGAVVDSVQEVFEMTASQIEPPPKIGTNLDTDFILGMGRRDADFIIILDVNKVFSGADLYQVQKAGRRPSENDSE